jgi:hypothetical protein
MDNNSIEKLALAEWASKEASGKLPEFIAQIEEARLTGIAFDLDTRMESPRLASPSRTGGAIFTPSPCLCRRFVSRGNEAAWRIPFRRCERRSRQ